jgi:hypothetical protein
MLIPVSAVGSLRVDPLAWVFGQTNMFPRAVTHATESFRRLSQYSVNQNHQTAR